MAQVEKVFEDEYILVVDKPTGLIVHSDGRTKEETLDDWVKENYPELNIVGNPHTLDSGRYTPRWGIVNRLDRDTSGIILIAKDDNTFFDLQRQFWGRLVEKKYLAKVWGGNTQDETGKISEPISRHKKDPRIWVCGTGVGERVTNKEAITLYRYIKSEGTQSLIEFTPITGRTHQLRLHARFLGHPIVGDKKYGVNGIANEHGTEQIKKVLDVITSKDLEADKNSRLMLHAKSLEFIHPHTREKLKVESVEPVDFS
jgi:23S rRNA pseudouridine1911/1915/1917 synthase